MKLIQEDKYHMRKTAGLLKFCCTFALVFEIIGAIMLVIAEAFLLFAGKFSDLAAKAGDAITVEGNGLTPEQMDALKPIILIVIALGLLSLAFAIFGTLKTRTALQECREERPFSKTCVDAIKASARLEIIGGIIGIVGSIVVSFMSAPVKILGTNLSSSMSSWNLSFLFYACEKYLLYHIAEYGHSLEKRA